MTRYRGHAAIAGALFTLALSACAGDSIAPSGPDDGERTLEATAADSSASPFTRALSSWTQPEPYSWAGFTLKMADVNGDRKADIVWSALGNLNHTYVALSNGDGTFRRLPNDWIQPELGWADFTLTTADVTGDGKADLVWSALGNLNHTYVALSKGDGTFNRLPNDWIQPELGWGGFTLTTADVNGDGKADLVWSALGNVNHTYVALSKGDGTFRRLPDWIQPELGWEGFTLSAADVDGNGWADLVWSALGNVNHTYVALSNGDGTFRRLPDWIQPELGWEGFTLSLADVNGDGNADMVWNGIAAQSGIYVALSNGDGTFRRALTDWQQLDIPSSGTKVTIADINADAKADLVWSNLGTANRTDDALSGEWPGPDPLATKFAPFLRFDSQAANYPMSAQIYYERVVNNSACQSSPSCMLDNTDYLSVSTGKVPTYYQKTQCGNQIRIVYWWFYGYQAPCISNMGAHNGDWEKVMVTLTEDQQSIAAVTYWAHGDRYTRLAAEGHVELYNGTHPIVYPGRLAHASYYTAANGSLLQCNFWGDWHQPAGQVMDSSVHLVNLDTGIEQWMIADRAGSFSGWGYDGVSTHPTTEGPTCNMAACSGDAFTHSAYLGSDCMYGDSAGTLYQLTCYTPNDEHYDIRYTLPTSNVGLTTPNPN